MKQTLLFLFFFFSFQGFAQNITLSIDPNPASVEVPASEAVVIAKASIKNDSDTDRIIKWKRNIIEVTETWDISICDKTTCYQPDIEEQEFDLAAGETSNLDVYAFPNMTEGAAIVEVTAFDAADESISVTGKYFFNADPTSTFSFKKPDVKIYPNPTAHYIALSHTEYVKQIIIYNIVGRPVKVFDADYGNRYNVADLPTGMYLVRLMDKNSQTLKTVRLSKKGGA